MEIKAADVKALRDKTGAGMMECKKALQHTNGNAQEAEKYLKEKGLAAVEKRADRATSEGIIVIKNDHKKAVIAELTCETDFVAKNTDFIATGESIVNTAFEKNYTSVTQDLSDVMLDLATRVRENMNLTRLNLVSAQADEYIASYVHSDKKTGVLVVIKASDSGAFENKAVTDFAYDCCLHVAAFTPAYIKESDIDQSHLDEQLAIFKAQVAAMDKPEQVKTHIAQGKLSKYIAEVCFLNQAFVKDDKVSVAKKMEEVAKSANTTLSLSHVLTYQLGAK